MGRPGRDPSSTLDVVSGANRIALLAGLVAGVAYSTFASFVANALTPVSGRLIELAGLVMASMKAQASMPNAATLRARKK